MSEFSSFSRLRKVTACVCCIFFIHSSVDGYLGCFHLWAYCEKYRYEHQCLSICSSSCFQFFCMNTQKWDCLDHTAILCLLFSEELPCPFPQRLHHCQQLSRCPWGILGGGRGGHSTGLPSEFLFTLAREGISDGPVCWDAFPGGRMNCTEAIQSCLSSSQPWPCALEWN